MKGSVYQRKDGRWVGVYDVNRDEFGKRKQRYVYGKTKKETTIKLNKKIYEFENGLVKELSKDMFIHFLYEYHKIKTNTWESTTSDLYMQYIKSHIEPYFGFMKLTDIKPATLEKYYIHKANEGLGNNTVRKLHVFIKSALNNAVKNNLIPDNPAQKADAPKHSRYMPTVYDDSDFSKLIECVSGTDDEIPILLAAGCGLRRGEVFGLRWNDINLDTGLINIRTTVTRYSKTVEKAPKTQTSTRAILAPGYVREALVKYYNFQKPDLSDKVITKWLPNSYSDHFGKLLKENKLQHIRFHDLRHYNAVIMMLKGIPDKVAAQRLGHSQVSTLREVYQHVLTEMDKKAAESINEIF